MKRRGMTLTIVPDCSLVCIPAFRSVTQHVSELRTWCAVSEPFGDAFRASECILTGLESQADSTIASRSDFATTWRASRAPRGNIFM